MGENKGILGLEPRREHRQGGGSVAGTIETLEDHTQWEERSRERSYVHTVVSADSGEAERPRRSAGRAQARGA
jgi:hypothetical protein